MPRRQRGTIIRLGSLYYIKYRDQQGKQQMHGDAQGHGFRTEADARSRLNEILVDIDKGRYVEPKTTTFADFAEQWIEGRMSIEAATASAYRSLINQHLTPNLGKLRLQDIRLETVQALVGRLAVTLSPKTLHNCVTLLHVMLVGKKGLSAVKLGYIRHDPTEGVELPRRPRIEIVAPAKEQVWALLDKAEELAKEGKCAGVGAAYSAILIGAATGLRRGELLAVRYTDVDWFASELLVARAVKKAKATDGVHKWAWHLGTTKNREKRRVGLSETVLTRLADMKRLAADPQGFIFTREMVGLKGQEFIDPDFFDAEVYGPVADAAGLSQVRFHDLRHFFASMLIAQGESAKYVCDQMGHSSIKVTFDTYGHLFPQARRDASARFESAMFADRRRKPAPEGLVEGMVESLPGEGSGARPN